MFANANCFCCILNNVNNNTFSSLLCDYIIKVFYILFSKILNEFHDKTQKLINHGNKMGDQQTQQWNNVLEVLPILRLGIIYDSNKPKQFSKAINCHLLTKQVTVILRKVVSQFFFRSNLKCIAPRSKTPQRAKESRFVCKNYCQENSFCSKPSNVVTARSDARLIGP